MSVGRYIMRGRVFQGRAFATMALANSGEEVVAADPMTGWRSASHSRSIVSRTNKASVAAKHSRVVVCFPEVRR